MMNTTTTPAGLWLACSTNEDGGCRIMTKAGGEQAARAWIEAQAARWAAYEGHTGEIDESGLSLTVTWGDDWMCTLTAITDLTVGAVFELG